MKINPFIIAQGISPHKIVRPYDSSDSNTFTKKFEFHNKTMTSHQISALTNQLLKLKKLLNIDWKLKWGDEQVLFH